MYIAYYYIYNTKKIIFLNVSGFVPSLYISPKATQNKIEHIDFVKKIAAIKIKS